MCRWGYVRTMPGIRLAFLGSLELVSDLPDLLGLGSGGQLMRETRLLMRVKDDRSRMRRDSPGQRRNFVDERQLST